MSATKKKRRHRKPLEIEPLLVKPRAAAVLLSLAYETVTRMVADGIFTAFAPKGRGVGKQYRLYRDEISVYVESGGDEQKLLAFRRQKGRLPKESR